MKTKKGRGRGRPTGSVSFTTVTLKELNSLLKEDSLVFVSRLWSANIGLTGKPVSAIHNAPVDVEKNVFDESKSPVNVKKNNW